MKQFFEQYGGVALGILALLVLIAMITPVGNIIKTSLQGTAETFSTQIGAQTDTALERAAYAQGVASDDIILVRNGSGSYSLSCEIDNANIERYAIRANDLDEGVPASDLYYDYMSKECSVSEMKGVIHYSTTKEGLEDLGMSIYHWEGGTWVLVSGDGSTKQSDRLPEVTGTVNYNGQTYELKYTLAFNSNGGTSVSSQKVSRIPENMYTPSKTGFTFSGWYTESSLTNRAVSGTKLTGDTTIYAGWNLQNYTIAYNLDGGTLSGQKTSYTINDSAYVLPTPTKEGFTFEGWYDNSSFSGTVVTSIPAGSHGNKTYYAKWRQNVSTTINFVVDGITYEAESGMTWYDWINSKYNIREFESYEYGWTVHLYKYKGSKGMFDYWIATESDLVSSDEIISENTVYSLSECGPAPNTSISFSINGTAYNAYKGMTWSDWVGSNLNTKGYYITSWFDNDDNVIVNKGPQTFAITETGSYVTAVTANDLIVSGKEYIHLLVG